MMLRIRWFVAWSAALLLVLLGSPFASAAPSTATRISDSSTAAVHLVINRYQATASVPNLIVSEDALAGLNDQLIRQAESGLLATDPASVQQAIIDAIAGAPATFLVPAEGTRSVDAEITGVGTAWTITPDGYLISAAHCIESTEEELAVGISRNALGSLLDEAVQELAAAESELTLTEGQLEQLRMAFAEVFAAHMQISNVTQSLTVRLAAAGEGGEKVGEEVPAEVIDAGEGFPGPDWAILKIEGENLPTVPIGEEQDVVVGAELYVMGYPADATFVPGFTDDSFNTPTLTQGQVTALKATEFGAPMFQSQAPASGGNSGGPAFDENGKAVGVLVAGAVDMSTGVSLDGQVWVLQNSVVKEALAANGVTPAESETTKVYNAALEAYYQQHYSAALADFERAKELYPTHPYVEGFITKSQQAIDDGLDQTPAGETGGGEAEVPWVWLALGGALLLGIALIAFGVVASRRQKAAQLVAGPPAQQWQQPQPAPQGQPMPQRQPMPQPQWQQQWQQPPTQQAPQPPAQQPPQGWPGQQGGWPPNSSDSW